MEQPIEANLGNKTFTRGVDTASDSIHKAIDSASGAATPALEQVTAGAHSAVDQMAGGAQHAADAVANGSAKLSELKQQFSERCRCQVREKPLLSLGMAIAGGVLLSWWFSRNSAAPK